MPREYPHLSPVSPHFVTKPPRSAVTVPAKAAPSMRPQAMRSIAVTDKWIIGAFLAFQALLAIALAG